MLHCSLRDCHTLRTTKTSKCSVTLRVRFADITTTSQRLELVRIVRVRKELDPLQPWKDLRTNLRSRTHQHRKLKSSVLTRSSSILTHKGMTLTRSTKVLITIEHDTHRTIQLFRSKRSSTETKTDLVSFPPNPPPIRFTLHTILLFGTPNTCATVS